MKKYFFLFALMLLTTQLAFAFESWEHKRMGDLAYHIAILSYCDSFPDDPACKALTKEHEQLAECDKLNIDDKTCSEFIKQLIEQKYCGERTDSEFCKDILKLKLDKNRCIDYETDQQCEHLYRNRLEELSIWFFDPLHADQTKIHAHTSYGDVVMCVDYYLSPEKFLAGRENYLIDDTDLASKKARTDHRGNPYVKLGQLYPIVRRDLDIYKDRCNDSYSNLEGARAGHVNHSHFQAELLVAQRSSHLLALMFRANEDNLFGALTSNAISDHYLQDSFAPGHITTWRSRLTDLAANAYHDNVNRKGMNISVDTKILKAMTRIPKGKKNQGDILKFIEKLLQEDKMVSDYFFTPGEIGKKYCNEKCDMNIEQIDSANKKVQSFILKLNNELDVKVFVKGDQQLWEHDQYEQRLIMLITQIRSLLDVLESHPERTINNEVTPLAIKDSFKNNKWSWRHLHLENDEDTMFSKLHTRPSNISADIGPIKYNITASMGSNDSNEKKDQINYDVMDKVFGVSFGIDNMTFGDQQNRKLINFETVALGQASLKRYSENWAILVGYQQFFSPISNGYSISSRLAYVKPEIETIASLQLRALHLNQFRDEKIWKFSLGGRIDFGFSSFLTTFIQVNKDSATQRDGRISSGWSIGAGIQLAAPTCRIPGLKNLNKCS